MTSRWVRDAEREVLRWDHFCRALMREDIRSGGMSCRMWMNRASAEAHLFSMRQALEALR